MWIDLTGNQHLDHEVAAIVSVQGINVLTALPVGDNPVLEQYKNRCPVHGTPFSGNRHCAECGFDWPAQNYLSSETGKTMWIDGFRTRGSNGQPLSETRQFIFTGDQKRGVAAQVMGDDRSFDITVHFFRGPEKPRRPVTRGGGYYGSKSILESVELESVGSKSFSAPPEIAAGALISQDIGVDEKSVNRFGQVAGIVKVYYVYENELATIINSRPHAEGGLTGLNVGNSTAGHKTY